jgi:anthranilate synthase component 1
MIQPDFREFQRLAKQGNLIPVYDVFPADLLTPVSAYLRLAQGARYSFLLESVEGGEKIARYTFAGANPEEIFRYAGGACVLESHNRIVWEERDPVTAPCACQVCLRSSQALSGIFLTTWSASSSGSPSACETTSACTTRC